MTPAKSSTWPRSTRSDGGSDDYEHYSRRLASWPLSRWLRAARAAGPARRQRERRPGPARELGIAAINVLEDDPELGLLLAIEAASIDDDVPTEVIDALHQALQAFRVEFTVVAPGGPGVSVAGGVAYSPDGTRLATTGDGLTVAIWDAETGAELATVGPEPASAAGPFPEVAWYGPDQVVTYGGSALEVWDVTTGELVHRMPSTGYGAGTIASDAGSQRIVTAGWSDDIRVWDPSTGEALRQTQPPDTSYGVAIDPDGTMLVAASVDKNAYIYDLETLDVRSELTGHTAGLVDATFSPDGSSIVTTAQDGTATVWSADDEPELLLVFEAHTGAVVTAEFSPDSRLVATAANDGRILIWEGDTGTVRLELTGLAGLPGQLSWNPDGTELAVASGGGVTQVFDVTPAGQQRGAHDRHRVGGSASRPQPRRRPGRDDRRRPDNPDLLHPHRCPCRSDPADG